MKITSKVSLMMGNIKIFQHVIIISKVIKQKEQIYTILTINKIFMLLVRALKKTIYQTQT
jgi:hypothetical protein